MSEDNVEHARGSIHTPRNVRFAIVAALVVLISGAVYLIAVRGQAMLLDLANSAAAFLCL